MAERSQLADQRGEAVPVELLYFADCPNHIRYLPQLRQLLARLTRPTVLVEREIADEETAVRQPTSPPSADQPRQRCRL